MNLPRILVVDDQFWRNATERSVFLGNVGLSEAKTGARRTAPPYAKVVFCPGQREEGRRIINDYAVVRETVSGGDWALVLLDVQFDSGDLDAVGRPAGQSGDDSFGATIRSQLHLEFPSLPVVMLTGKSHEEIGESDTPYLSKHKLDSYELRRALLRSGRVDVGAKHVLLGLNSQVCAEDPATLASFQQAFIHARSDVSILVLGESGTGKEVLANYVHRLSGCASAPFIPVNVAAIPGDLVESELFGIGKRIATGVDSRPGKFELASGGTLFLDEIGDMPLEIQAKVLRTLQESKIVRVGESKEISVDIRLVCATSRDLGSRVVEGLFRSDLLYRINKVPITMAPLRERRGDIAPLASVFLKKYAGKQGKAGLSFSAETIALLSEQSFPGNVRELENLVERLASAAGHHQIIGRREVLDILEPGLPLARLGIATVGAKTTPQTAVSAPGFMKLEQMLAMLDMVQVDKGDPALKGITAGLDAAVQSLRQRLAGAALERCRDPNDHKLNRQSAMRLLTGDATLKGKGPARVINEILGRKADMPVSDNDLEQLVAAWSASRRGNR
jgi:DNA-binding NtrC family response regulator